MNKKVILSGDLNFLSLADLLQLLGSNGSTGVLRINNKYAQGPGLIYFIEGNPADASSGSLSGLDALYSLFGWTEGKFEFSKEQVTRNRVIKNSRMEIILEGLRKLDDGQIEKIGPVVEKATPGATGKEKALPFIKGPFVDYLYVVDEETHPDGATIAEEGKHGNWLWVILEGVMEVVKETPHGTVPILRLGDGSFIGSMASFSIDGNIRSATVVAVGNVQLGVLDSQRLATEYACMSNELKELVLSLDRRLRQVTDRAVDIYLKQHSLKEFTKDKKTIIKQKSNFEKLLTIEQGEACIVQSTDYGHIPLANLGKRDFIGHVPFLDIGHEPYSASVLAPENIETIELNTEDLQNEFNKLSGTLKNFIENIATCISVTTRMAAEFQKKAGSKKSGKS